MNECCACCCPPPQSYVIYPRGTPGTLRQIIKYIVWAELVVCVLMMLTQELDEGALHSIQVWIDYMAYASMYFCQCIIVIIVTAIDLFMQVYYYSSSDEYKKKVNATGFSQVVFWAIVSFNVFKIIVFFFAYTKFKKAFYYEHGHTNCCEPFTPVSVRDGDYVPPGSGQSSMFGGMGGGMGGMGGGGGN